jgi:hypothetical protein
MGGKILTLLIFTFRSPITGWRGAKWPAEPTLVILLIEEGGNLADNLITGLQVG